MTQTTTVNVHHPVVRHVSPIPGTHEPEMLDINFGDAYHGSVSFIMTGDEWDALVADVAARRVVEVGQK